ncbi:hydantoinase B/oxoprolinase family protein [Herbaspirillum sp. RTI4]|uniref:hydantoinase B/oxoprolinase family protein n=1 Tax=Herbaspirillum sp. RTI4 TaxID=3048640 RepID=UPI002AB55B0E|nr:hydantoinase B/oxoprolinase family protein [Herbaspirillum sp. RTI4]MDY7578012.1 hydantoinase B/oxoprolinase family protein [Herbaspirillum sp. RTI4]MEA9982058.1 hydantoinase B/oxoprolinase family protein [Herbaspirillum sp. RTI4]
MNQPQQTSHGEKDKRWQFWIDRGGTFTDIVARHPDGHLLTHKLLSENPEQYKDAAVAGIKSLLGIAQDQAISPDLVEAVKMGTTVATNALLERKGDPTVLLITKGFRDALRIAYQNRPRLFDRHLILPELLYSKVIEVTERVGARGDIITPLDEAHVRTELSKLYDEGFRTVAIVLMHGYRFTAHEEAVARIAQEIGFPQISVSHKVSPMMKLVSRGDTAVVDAYLSPILRRYVEQVSSQMDGVQLLFMQSNGGLTDAHRFQGKDSILSGPAGGIVGMVRTAQTAGFDKIIGFDMGGTSTDVSHYAGEFEREFETQVAGVRMRAPMMSIHTVAAGGGSILHFDGARYRVGPDSAGANPGPTSYRRGGALAVTDCNVMLGKIQPQHFPSLFGPNADQPLDRDAVVAKFTLLAEEIFQGTGNRRTPEEVAEGFIDIAVGNMANAIKFISVQRGHDVSDYTLTTFGGAGGQHACLVADALGMTRVFAHPLAGVLSAYGMGLADQTAMREQAVEIQLSPAAVETLQQQFITLADDARSDLLAQGVAAARIDIVQRVHLRYDGTDSVIVVPFDTLPAMIGQFESAYQKRYSFLMHDKPMMVEAVSVEAIGVSTDKNETVEVLPARDGALPSAESVQLFSAGKWHTTALYKREDMRPGDIVRGPAIIAEKNATNIVEPGWMAEVTELNHLLLTRYEVRQQRKAMGTTADPVMLEVFNNLFMSIAEQMGLRLQNTAISVNIKERLDFSCALFDADGNLIANAPHIPVHLGSMGDSIKTIIRDNAGKMTRGDVFMLNDPYHGGTHLPDITVITPVFEASGRDILFYVGSRGHHADIGGITPGSMPANSTTVEEEGILINNFQLVRGGRFLEAETIALLSSGPYPARNIPHNLADLQAQIAANQKGVEELLKMVAHYGLDVVQAYMGHVQDNAEEAVRRVISTLKDCHYEYKLDNGAVIQVALRIDHAARTADIDFTGTSPQLSNNFNAPSAICMAAVLYVFRTLVDDEIPLNAGCLKPLNVIIPPGSMLNPHYPAAVVSGNVETSSCITNALYGALGVLASAPGTMNNFTFGNKQYQYYETISGGSGAGRGFDGTDVVQTHMTNSRLTDPEILEWRYPVRLESYEIRPGSGGAGQWHGGNGGIRKVRFLEKMTASILSNNRIIPPFGMDGGAPGQCGKNYVLRNDGSEEAVSFVASTEMEAGDIFVIETPGGGGFGTAS